MKNRNDTGCPCYMRLIGSGKNGAYRKSKNDFKFVEMYQKHLKIPTRAACIHIKNFLSPYLKRGFMICKVCIILEFG